MILRNATLTLALAAVVLTWTTSGWTHDGVHAGKQASPRSDLAAPQVRVARDLQYAVPDVRVVDAHGKASRLADHFSTTDVLLLNFVFTTCSTVCSSQTAVLSETQRRLLASGRRARFVSVTIDPDNDTPQQLAAFARQFDIRRDWTFFTGEFDDLLRIQQAFDVYRGSKAGHPPVVLLKLPEESTWVRIEGIAAPSDLLAVVDQRGTRR